MSMSTNRALEILAMSEQARWTEGIEPEDVEKAVETIRKALQSRPATTKIIELTNDKGQRVGSYYYYDETRQLIFTGVMARAYAERQGFTIKMPSEEVSE